MCTAASIEGFNDGDSYDCGGSLTLSYKEVRERKPGGGHVFREGTNLLYITSRVEKKNDDYAKNDNQKFCIYKLNSEWN